MRRARVYVAGIVAAIALSFGVLAQEPFEALSASNPLESLFGALALSSSPNDGDPPPTFDTLLADGPAALSSSLTVNGSAMTLLVDCDARGISGATWTCGTGGTLAETGASGTVTSGKRTPVFATDTAARAVSYTPGGNKGHQSASSTLADIGTADFAVEVVLSAEVTTDGYVTGNYSGTSGWLLYRGSGPALRFAMHDGSIIECNTTVAGGAWYHFMAIIDRSYTVSRVYVNGVGANCNQSAQADSIASSENFFVSRPSAGVGYGGNIALVRVWECPSSGQCFTGDAAFVSSADSVAAERFARVSGSYAPVGGVPTTATRASVAYTDADLDGDGVRRLALVGSSWIRAARRKEASGGEYVSGRLHEATAANLALQSAAIGTTWTNIDAGDTHNSNTTTGPEGSSDPDSIICSLNAVSRICGKRQSITLTAVAHTFSTFVKDGGYDHVALRVNTIANTASWFNVATCTTGTKGSAATTSTAESYGSGWCRISITYTGTAAAHDHDIILAVADNDIDFANPGGGEIVYAWGHQVEAGTFPTSQIPTTTASATRAAELLVYPSSFWPSGSYTLEAKALCPASATWPNGQRIVHLGGASDYSEIIGGASTGPRFRGTNGGAQWDDDANTPTYGSGEIVTARLVAATNNIRFFVDGVAMVTTDTSATSMTPASGIYIGSDSPSGAQPNCLIGRVRIWPGEVLP